MTDTRWLFEAMGSSKLALRMDIVRTRGTTDVTAKAYHYWLDDAQYMGAEVTYRSFGEVHHPLALHWLSSDATHGWATELEQLMRSWPAAWHEQSRIVCTHHEPRRRAVQLPVTNPEVLVHLARFETLASQEAARGVLFDSITFGDVARRLNGIIRSQTASWNQMMGVHPNYC